MITLFLFLNCFYKLFIVIPIFQHNSFNNRKNSPTTLQPIVVLSQYPWGNSITYHCRDDSNNMDRSTTMSMAQE